ncbi:cytochrome b/b6 domain-containing protein [Hydrogenophaga sp.]|uniref:cytochrome b n=1 Tax=Hydrogenophaga sp. TaxID=1904254 RepID=UPI0025C20D6D|nr:cytochrome b/b6 domain-containing protein [Hydrogenophaga sp.]
MNNHSPSRHDAFTQGLHWATAVLVVAAFIYGLGGSEARVYLPARDFERSLHETLGMGVFALTLLRLLWRGFATRPAEEAGTEWMRRGAGAVQIALYGLLLAVPATAVAGAWLQGHTVLLLGGTEIASLVAPSYDVGNTVAEIHTWLGDAIVWIAGAHAVAAIAHHVLLKDGVLLSILPSWLPLKRRP